MRKILSIDPGSLKSGYVIYRPPEKGKPSKEHILDAGVILNGMIFNLIFACKDYDLVIEQFVSYGSIMGKDCVKTIEWAERFRKKKIEVSEIQPVMIPRYTVKKILFGKKAKDAGDKHVRGFVLDKFGLSENWRTREKDLGFKLSSHAFQAMGLAIVYKEWYLDYYIKEKEKEFQCKREQISADILLAKDIEVDKRRDRK